MFSGSVPSQFSTWLVIAVGVILLSGCAVMSREATMYHSFSYPVPTRSEPATVPETLMIYRFLLKPGVDADFLIVSDALKKEAPAGAHRWSRSPADMISDLIERDLAGAGIFENTVGQFSNARYRYALEGSVLDMRGVRAGDKTTARLTVEATLTDFGVPLGADKTILKRSYRIEVPSKDASPAAIVEALNVAVRQFSQKLRADIASALRSTGGTGTATRAKGVSDCAVRV